MEREGEREEGESELKDAGIRFLFPPNVLCDGAPELGS